MPVAPSLALRAQDLDSRRRCQDRSEATTEIRQGGVVDHAIAVGVQPRVSVRWRVGRGGRVRPNGRAGAGGVETAPSRSKVPVMLVTIARCTRLVCPPLTTIDWTNACPDCTSKAPMSAAGPLTRM